MLLSHIDELLIDQVAKSILLDGVHNISQATQAYVTSTTRLGLDNNDHWTAYFAKYIPYGTTSAAHDSILKEIRRRRLSHLVPVVAAPKDVVATANNSIIQPSDVYILQLAYARVEQPWMTIPEDYQRYLDYFRSSKPVEGENDHNGKAQKNTSISLFNVTSSSTSLLNSFMTLDIIKERTGNKISDMVLLLKDVMYLEDMIPDMDEICELLRNELVMQILPDSHVDTTKNDHPNNDCGSLGQSIMDLHRHWFHRTRKGVLHASTTHDDRRMQTELLYNLIQVLQLVDSTQPQRRPSSSGTDSICTIRIELYQSCLMTILDMFTDWMDRNIYRHGDLKMKEIGKVLWNWSIGDITRISSNVNKVHILYQHDPLGHWICQYLTQRYMTKSELIELLSQPSTSNSHSGNAVLDLYNVAMETLSSSELSNRNDHLCTFIWILSIFRSVLLVTRVSSFPWNLLAPTLVSSTAAVRDETMNASPNKLATIQNPTAQSILRIFSMYHQFLVFLTSSQIRLEADSSPLTIDMVGSICIDSIEILICGTQRNELLHAHTLMIQEMHSISRMNVTEDSEYNSSTCSSRIATMVQNMERRLQLSGISTK